MLKERWDTFVSALNHPIAQGLARTVTEIQERPPKGGSNGAVYLLFPNRRLQAKAAQYRPCFVECAAKLLSHPISIEFVVVPFSIPVQEESNISVAKLVEYSQPEADCTPRIENGTHSTEKSYSNDDINAIAQSLAQAMDGEVLE